MEYLIDSSLLVDYLRSGTPEPVREQVSQWIHRPDAVVAAPVTYEILRAVRRSERSKVDAALDTFPLLETPNDLWDTAVLLGRKCVDRGLQAGPIDLLIAAVAIHHDVELVTFDRDYAAIAEISGLRAVILERGA